MVRLRRSPRKHRVREHGRGKPTGGKTDVGQYDRGRGGRSETSASAGGRAQVRSSFLEVKDVLTKVVTPEKARISPEFIEFDDKNLAIGYYRHRMDAQIVADRMGVEVIPVRKNHQGRTRRWFSVWGVEHPHPPPEPRKKKPISRAVVDSMKDSARQTADAVLGPEEEP